MPTHAEKRMKQRGIPPLVLLCLRQYGKKIHDHHGGVIRYFDKEAKRNVERNWGREAVRRILADYMDAYIVESVIDNALITVGRRYKKIRH